MSQERAKQPGNNKQRNPLAGGDHKGVLTSAPFFRLKYILLNSSDQTLKEGFWRLGGESVFSLKRRCLKTQILLHTMTAQF